MTSMVMAEVAPSASPKSSAAAAPKASSPKSSSAPATSPKATPSASAQAPSTSSPASSPSGSEDEDISAPPAPGSDPIELFGPGPAPADDGFAPEASPVEEVASGASTVQFSFVAAIVAVGGFLAF
ncbi:hypothetical protein QL285_079695 [Trifolium repens]|nr:hypothetical protein QL285_079695 [Trifolium repens]